MEWKAEYKDINGIKQIQWTCGTKHGTYLGDLSKEPKDVVKFIKDHYGEEEVKKIEEEGAKEVPPIDFEKMFEEMTKNEDI